MCLGRIEIEIRQKITAWLFCSELTPVSVASLHVEQGTLSCKDNVGWTQFHPQVFCRTLLLSQESNVTFHDGHLSLRLKIAYSNPGCSTSALHPLLTDLPLMMCAALPVLLPNLFVVAIWAGLEPKDFFPRQRKTQQKVVCVFTLLWFMVQFQK